MTLSILVAVAALAGIAALVGSTWWRSEKARKSFEAAYRPLPPPALHFGESQPQGVRYAIAEGAQVTPAQLAGALQLARRALTRSGPWGGEDIARRLADLKILVRAEPTWIDAYGRRVAGLARLDQNLVEIGSDLKSFAHEIAEICYWRETGLEDFQAHGWQWQHDVEVACANYASCVGTLLS